MPLTIPRKDGNNAWLTLQMKASNELASQGPITRFNNTSRRLSKQFGCANQTEQTIYSYRVRRQLPALGTHRCIKVRDVAAISGIKREPLPTEARRAPSPRREARQPRLPVQKRATSLTTPPLTPTHHFFLFPSREQPDVDSNYVHE